MNNYKEFKKKARHETDSIFPILFVDPITTRIAYWLKKRNSKINPNSITKSRLFFISPAIIVCLLLAPLLQMKEFYLASIILFYFIFFTDSLDGQLARGLNRKSKRGAFLDSIADRFGTIIFITMTVSVGLFLQNQILIYGGILLFVLKTLHLMIITKIYYYKEMWGDKENKSEVFGGGEGLNKLGILQIFIFFYKIFKPILPKRCDRFLGGYEVYIIEIILPIALILLNQIKLMIILNLILIFFFSCFFIYRIKKITY